jgi:hypothetical protein
MTMSDDDTNYEAGSVCVAFKDGTPRDQVDAIFRKLGLKVENHMAPIGLYVVATVPGSEEAMIATLRQEAIVDRAHLNGKTRIIR